MKSLMLLVAALAVTTGGAVATAEIATDDPLAPISTEEALETVRQVAPEVLAPDPRLGVTPTAGDLVVTGVAAGTTIDDDPAGGFSLGTAGGRLDVEPEEVGFEASEVEVLPGTDTTIATDTGPEVDTLTKPIPGGIETFTVIRGPSAPTSYAWRVTLPDGALLRKAPDGGVYVLRDGGAVVARITPPWARDATGSVVATRFRVDGDLLTLEVDHTAPGVAYPVIADPSLRRWAVKIVKKTVKVAVAVGKKAGPVVVKVLRHPATPCIATAIATNPGGLGSAVRVLAGCLSGG